MFTFSPSLIVNIETGFIFDKSFGFKINLITFIFVEIFPHLARPGSRAARAQFII